MKLYSSKIAGFLSSFEKDGILASLVYGPNSGGVEEVFQKISKKIVPDLNDPFLVSNIDANQIFENDTIIYDEAISIPFMGGKKIVIVKGAEGKDVTSKVISSIENLPADNHQNCFILITAGELTTSSALRKFFEKGKNLAAIACYEEDSKSMTDKISSFFIENKMKSSFEVVKYISENIRGDSKILSNFLDKCLLYLGENNELKIENVNQILGYEAENKIQDIIDAFLNRKNSELEFKIRQLQEENISEIAVIRSLSKYLEKIYFCLEQVSTGKNVDEAVRSLRPPVFFKQVPNFKKQVSKFLGKEDRIMEFFYKLTLAEASLKESGSEPYLILSRLLNFKEVKEAA